MSDVAARRQRWRSAVSPVSSCSCPWWPFGPPCAGAALPLSSRGSDHRRRPSRHPGGADLLPGARAGLHQPGPGVQRHVQSAGDRRERRRVAARLRRVQGRGRGHGEPGARRSAQDPADRVRTHGADRVRPGGAAAIRDDGRHSAREAAPRAGDAQHPRRTLGDLQGRIRSASVGRPAAGGCAAGVRGVPATARRAGARRGA